MCSLCGERKYPPEHVCRGRVVRSIDDLFSADEQAVLAADFAEVALQADEAKRHTLDWMKR